MEDQQPGSMQVSPPARKQQVRRATPEQSRKELNQAIRGSNDVLMTAQTTFTLFPGTITIDRAKLTVTKRTFMRTAEVMSISMEDVLNVTATLGPMFGTVKIVSRVLTSSKPYSIGLLWRADALRLKRIAQGYVIALQREIDCSALVTEELITLLDQLGEDDHPTN